MRSLALLASVLVLTVPQVAAAQTEAAASAPCLTPREFTALATYALPSLISGTTKACSTTLPAGAYLRRSGTELAQRYAVGKPKAWPDAKAAFLKMTAGRDRTAAQVFSSMPDDSLQQVADAAFAGIAAGQVKPASCTAIDRLLALLAPLPAENTAEVIAVAVGLGSQTSGRRLSDLALCKA